MTEKIEDESSNSLEIVIKKDIERDITLIKETFQRTDGQHFRNWILYFYKTLNKKLEGLDSPKVIVVEEYFRKLYVEEESRIDKIVADSEKILKERAPASLKALSLLMDCEPGKSEEFIAIPTLLPYSPFNRPVFFFSIAGELFGGRENEVLDIAIHEISHFLFFDIFQKLQLNFRNNPKNRGLEHLFKEALTGMLLSEPELEALLDRKNYLGNPEVHFLSVKTSTGETVLLREYLRQVFRDYRSRGLSFSDFIRDEIQRMIPKAEEFQQKKTFWDENERELRSEGSKLLESYREPIEI